MPPLIKLTRKDSPDNPYSVTERNTEVACAYALRAARGWRRRMTDWMDPVRFEECALQAVLEAAQRYDPTNGASFFTYAQSKVTGALREEDRSQRRRGPTYSIEESYSFSAPPEEMDALRIHDRLCSDEDIERDAVSRQAVRYILDVFCVQAGLTDREIAILRMRYVEDVRQKDIAIHFKVTPGRIHQIEDAAIRKLQLAAADGDLALDCEVFGA